MEGGSGRQKNQGDGGTKTSRCTLGHQRPGSTCKIRIGIDCPKKKKDPYEVGKGHNILEGRGGPDWLNERPHFWVGRGGERKEISWQGKG